MYKLDQEKKTRTVQLKVVENFQREPQKSEKLGKS